MKHWWVPGLQIGYEHTFVHQVADFLEALRRGQAAAADVPRRPGDRLRHRRGPEVGEDAGSGRRFNDRQDRDGGRDWPCVIVIGQHCRFAAAASRSRRRRHSRLPGAGAGGARRAGQGRGRGGGGGFRQPDPIDFARARRLDVALRRQDRSPAGRATELEGRRRRDHHRADLRKADRHGVSRLAGRRGGRLRAEDGDEGHRQHQRRRAVSRLDRAESAAQPAAGRRAARRGCRRLRRARRPLAGRGGRGPQGPARAERRAARRPIQKSEEQWNMWGAQYDFDAGNRYTGQFYEQNTGRGIVAWKGQVVRTEEGKNPRLLATLGEPAVDRFATTSPTTGTSCTSSRSATP